RRAYLGVVVEVDVDVAGGALPRGLGDDALGIVRLAAAGPGGDARGPAIERVIVVAAGVQHFRAVQAAVDEVRGQVHQTGPFHRVGADQADPVPAQQRDEGRVAEAVVTDLDRVADRALRVRAGPGAVLEAAIVPAGDARGGLGVAR